VAVYPDCWCICLCYLHFAPENPEDGEMYILVPAHPGCPRHSPESHKMVVCVLCFYVLNVLSWRHIARWWHSWLHNVAHEWSDKIAASSPATACVVGTYRQCQRTQEIQVSALIYSFHGLASTKLLYIQPGSTGMGDHLRSGIPP